MGLTVAQQSATSRGVAGAEKPNAVAARRERPSAGRSAGGETVAAAAIPS